jgi:bifunctional UDP-N-acetylglucosamine pyrophosphorylase/glucosamine-1-phosphate N-acetyltransferase
MCAEEALADVDGSLVVIAGDCPLFTPETIASLVAVREERRAAATVLTTRLGDPTGYGRIVRDDAGEVLAIVEHKDLAPSQVGIDEVNTSTYCFDARTLFARLHKLENANAQGEYYLTDMIALLREEGLPVLAVEAEDPTETLGINTRVQLAEAAGVLQRRINERHMLAGVTMVDPALVWIGPHVEIGRDTVIEPGSTLLGVTSVGPECVIGPNTQLIDASVGAGCRVNASVVESATVPDGISVGPWQHVGSSLTPGGGVVR